MKGSLQKNPQITILPGVGVNERLRLREADIDEVVKTVQGVLPEHVDEDMDVTITLLEKNLKIMADMALMKEALTHLVKNAMDAMPGCGKFTLTNSQVNFEVESLLKSDDAIIGACALISLAGVCAYMSVDEKIKGKILEPFFTANTDIKGRALTTAYRIIKQHWRKRTELNMYLPLTKLEMVNMMSIPVA